MWQYLYLTISNEIKGVTQYLVIIDLLNSLISLLSFLRINIRLEPPDIAKGGKRHLGGQGVHCNFSLDLLIEWANFVSYCIKIQQATSEIAKGGTDNKKGEQTL